MVDPSEQDGLRTHLHEVVQVLTASQQVGQPGALLQADLVEQPDPDDLPEQSKDQVRGPLGQVVGVNVDDGTTNGLG